LFLRTEGERQSVYRIALVGGEPRKLVEDAQEADWSPDGQRLAFVRQQVSDAERVWTLRIADLRDGSDQELLAVKDRYLSQPRFAPDGKSIAVIRAQIVSTNDQNDVLAVEVATRKARSLTPRGYQLGCLAWSARGAVLARAVAVVGDLSGAPSRVFALDLESGKERSLFWTTGLFPLAGRDVTSATCDVLGDRRLVFDSIQASANLSEVDVGGGAAGQVRGLSQGSSRDRQPSYSPDGGRIVFSSNRSGNLDLWSLDRRTGALRQLTDDPAQDWDPGFTPDGRNLLWSSDRSGHLEIWIASADGSGARQLTRDGVGAENPTATPDGSWIVYASTNPERSGIWKIRADGSDSRMLAGGPYATGEVSPDGRYTAFLEPQRRGGESLIRFVETASGAPVPFQIQVGYSPGAPGIVWGRVRWTPDARHVVFIGADATGRTGVFMQDFMPGRDSTATRRPLAGFSADYTTESLGLSRDGRHLTIATLRRFGSLWLAESLEGVDAPVRALAR
jgi:Tol biopolymer transport system component